MKVKTSITLTEGILDDIDREIGGKESRSEFIERAVVTSLQKLSRKRIDARDLRIINRNADRLNREAEEVLEYQGDL